MYYAFLTILIKLNFSAESYFLFIFVVMFDINRLFLFKFCSDLICNKTLKVGKFVCARVEFLTFTILLQTNIVPKVIDN